MSESGQKLSGKMKILFGVSLAFNLLVVGLVVGFLAKGGPRGPVRTSGDTIAPFAIALEPSERRTLGREIFGKRPKEERARNRKQLRQEFEGVLTILKAETFDKVAFAAQLSEISEKMRTNVARAQALLADHIAGMSHEDRLEYAARVQKVIERGPRRHKPER